MSYREIKTDKITVQKDLIALSKIFSDAGFSLYLVGGALRDMYLQRKNYDIDVATDAKPEYVVKLFRKTIPTGIKHGTVTIRFRGHSIECTTMRRDAGYSDSRHPDSVEYGSSIVEDLSRRDFSMNAIAASLPEGSIIDPYNGRQDINAKIIRAVGEPLMRFSEDGLRPMRALRFASQLGFEIEENTLKAIPLSLERMKSVSIERFQDEFNKMIKGEHFPTAMLLMKETGVLHLFIPQFDAFEDADLKQMLHASSLVPKELLVLRLSLIFYWIYKQENKNSTQTIEIILKNLKYPNKVIDEILHFVQYCNFEIEMLNNGVNIRRFLKNIGSDNVHNMFILKKAIEFSKMKKHKASYLPTSMEESSYTEEQRNILTLLDSVEKEVQTVLGEKPALSIKELAINGEELFKIGIPKGPQMGKVLNELLDIVIKTPQSNKKEELIEEALRIVQP